MKKVLFFVIILAIAPPLSAQVHIEALDFPTAMTVPGENQMFARYQIASDSNSAYLYMDTCNMLFYDFGNFSGMSLRNVRLFVDGEERLMQMTMPGDFWQFYPSILLGFPYGFADTAQIHFLADLPDTLGDDFIPSVGDSLYASIHCSCHYVTGTGSFATNEAISQTVFVTSSSVGIAQPSPQNFSERQNARFFDILGREISRSNLENLPPGVYIWRSDRLAGKILVR